MPGGDQRETFQKLTTILLLTYALRNADCHSKNLALLYTSRTDARLAPAYDFFTTSAYEGYQNSPPGISFMGRKTWLPGKPLGTFITSTFGISQREQKEILERISDAVADTAPAVREVMKSLAGFKDTGKRMLVAWSEGVSVLRDSRMYGLSPWKSSAAFEGISDPPKPDFKYVATHICDSIKRRLRADGSGDGLQGEFGIGLLSFWTVGERTKKLASRRRPHPVSCVCPSPSRSAMCAAVRRH